MMEDLAGGSDFTRICTAENLVQHSPGVDDSLPLLGQIIRDRSTRVRNLAIPALGRLAARLDLDSVAPYESKLFPEVSDVPTLALVLLVYSRHRHGQPGVMEKWRSLILRTIEQSPNYWGPLTPFLTFHPRSEREDFDTAKRLWLQQIDANPANAQIIGNAALFLCVDDVAQATALLSKCKELEPNNSEWPGMLGLMYSQEAEKQPTVDLIKWSRERSLAEYEIAASLCDEYERRQLLWRLGEGFCSAGQYPKARHYSEELLRPGPGGEHPFTKGISLYKGNLTLGRISLIEGDLEQAKQRLISSVVGSEADLMPVFTAGFADMALAKELLELGEREIVVDYLSRCGTFWTSDRGLVSRWIAEIEAGGTPDFGGAVGRR